MNYYHEYKCLACHQTVRLVTESFLNPLSGRLYAHNVIVNAKTRDQDPFLQGLGILEERGSIKPNCSGSFKYLGASTSKPTGMSAAPAVAKTPAQVEAANVYADMKSQFDSWNGTVEKRGAWWGSRSPGDTTHSKNVPPHVIPELRKLVSNSWEFTDSRTGGISFHRKKNNSEYDFIYHMQRSN